ncbi:hypothetical protein scyTo_0016186 [Scyliorhinus torazame]|uniref:Uncharacterized protein n=1 Tax=Scyliorhinus torazame TaxID=75743 RepID=A0A401Q4U1_SCYTO|nr:hypothetical protein [Scyliorhinus torazame]
MPLGHHLKFLPGQHVSHLDLPDCPAEDHQPHRPGPQLSDQPSTPYWIKQWDLSCEAFYWSELRECR